MVTIGPGQRNGVEAGVLLARAAETSKDETGTAFAKLAGRKEAS